MSEPCSDINQLLMQVRYNFQVLRRLVDLARSYPESLISESDLELLISGEFLISSESDLNEFVLVAVVSPSDANDEGLESLVVVAEAVGNPSDAIDEGLESLVVSRSS